MEGAFPPCWGRQWRLGAAVYAVDAAAAAAAVTGRRRRRPHPLQKADAMQAREDQKAQANSEDAMENRRKKRQTPAEQFGLIKKM